MKIVIATPEAVPYIKTGGLADVAGALCKHLKKLGEEPCVVLPLYKVIKNNAKDIVDTGLSINVPVGDSKITGKIYKNNDSSYLFIDCPIFFNRDELYGTPEGDYADNCSRFVFFSRGIIEMCKELNFRPDIIHCNDWQTSLIPLYLKTLYKSDKFFENTATLLTIHNLGYQGLFPPEELYITNLGWDLFTPEGIEFYGKINFLKAGLLSAEILTTVSPTYSREILKVEYGFGLDGVLRVRESDLYGVINGIDYDEWNPSKDSYLSYNYDYNNLEGRKRCRVKLFKDLFGYSKKIDKVPIIGMVGRLSEQKGLDILLDAIPDILAFDVRIVILGKGDERYHNRLKELFDKFKGRLFLKIGFDEKLAHLIYAGSDFFLMPSKYEPCGLGQLIALRYGSIPIVRDTGGLSDTIEDFNPLSLKGTGFVFKDFKASSLLDALKRSFCLFTEKDKMMKVIKNCMKRDFSWKKSTVTYLELYEKALEKRLSRI
jgi:starch synthase